MIRLLKTEKSDSTSQLYFTTLVDAKAADITEQDHKNEAEKNISKYLVSLSQAVTSKRATDAVEQSFKEYLRENLFKHYVDVVSINDFIYDSRQAFFKYRDNIILAGFHMMYEYINYYGKEKGDV